MNISKVVVANRKPHTSPPTASTAGLTHAIKSSDGDAIDAYSLHVGGAFRKRGPTACVSVSCFQSAYWSSLQTRKLPEQGVLRSSGEEQISSVASSGERRQHESESRGRCRSCRNHIGEAGAGGRLPDRFVGARARVFCDAEAHSALHVSHLIQSV